MLPNKQWIPVFFWDVTHSVDHLSQGMPCLDKVWLVQSRGTKELEVAVARGSAKVVKIYQSCIVVLYRWRSPDIYHHPEGCCYVGASHLVMINEISLAQEYGCRNFVAPNGR